MYRVFAWLKGARRQPIADTEEKLHERNVRLDAALNNMSQGLCMFDADERIVVLNRRFLEMYQLSPVVVRPGCTLMELLRHRKEVGVLEIDPVEFYGNLKRDLAKGRTTQVVHTTCDGRFILAHNQPMPGGGWVTTHEDITERRKAEALVSDQKLQLDAALNNMSQGLCMYDAQGRLMLWNHRYMQMYGLAQDAVAAGTTLRQLIELRNSKGVYSKDPQHMVDDLTAAVAAGRSISFVTELSDGRVIAIANTPMADGRWVSTHEDITEQRRAEERLREQKLQLDAALDNMSQGLLMFDRETRLVFCNERYLQMYGIARNDAQPGTMLQDLLELRRAKGNFPRDPAEYIAMLREQLAAGQSVTFSTDLPDGRVIQVYNRPLADGRWVSSHEDITERRHSEELLRDQKLQLDTALKNMSQGLCMYDADGRVLVYNPRYAEMMSVSQEFLVNRTFLELLQHRKAEGHFLGDPDAVNASLLKTMRDGKGDLRVVERGDGRVLQIVRQPMATGGWIATMEDITERRVAQERLRDQKLQLDAALGNMSQGLCMFDAEGRVVLCNPRYAEITGIASEALRGLSFRELLKLRKDKGEFAGDPEDYSATVIKSAREGRSITRIVQQRDGRVHRIVAQPMQNGGWVSTIEDITEQQRAEELVAKQKLQLDAALANMSQGLCMLDSDSRFVLCNARYAEMMGFTAEQLIRMTFLELLKIRRARGDISENPEEIASAVMRAVREGKSLIKTVERNNGHIYRIIDMPMASGGWITTMEDISEQHRAEQRLREQKLQLDTALNNMSQGLNMFDSEGRLVVLNDRYLEMYHLSKDSVKPGCTVQDLVQARIENGTFFSVDPEEYKAGLLKGMERREPTSTEMELPDGRTISIFSQPTPDGRGWVVTHEDITERRHAEKERDRSQAFVSTVIENVPATIVVKDARTLRYVLVNRAGEAYFGAQRETMIGKTSDEIFPPETAATIAEHDHALLRTGQPQFYDEHPTNTPGAGPRIVTTMRTPIRDKQGETAYLLTVIEDRTNRKRAEAQIAHMAHHDALTGLPNRAAFNACLNSTIEAAAKEGSSFALMSLDVDRFKEINDVFGHVIGDDLLCELSRRLQRIAGGAFVARLGGDEFTIISTDGEQPAAAETLANEIIDSVAKEFHIDNHHLRIGISIGVAVFPTDGTEAETLVANADAALYRAKSEGRAMYRFFEAGMDKSLRERRALQHDLQTAIENGELTLHYQPQARIGGGIIGFEALARWRHPARGVVSPGTFIPLAEESGLIVPMGEWILREACREAATWAKPLQIGINLSPVQFRHGDLPAMVHSVLLETGLTPSRLELEITEGVLIGDFARAVSILRRLKALGVRIAMDDFGTGYSSLSYLQSFPFDKIKIDRAFISNLESTPQSATIVRAVIGLARALNLPVLAEGVETQAQLDFLASEHCDEIQGYLIGRPQPIAEYAHMTAAGDDAPIKPARTALAG